MMWRVIGSSNSQLPIKGTYFFVAERKTVNQNPTIALWHLVNINKGCCLRMSDSV